MRKKPKIRIENIITAILFIVGFYIGTLMLPHDNSALFNLSANAAMLQDEEKISFFQNFTLLISRVIPTHDTDIAQPSEVSPSPVPSATVNYTPDAPVLASSSGKNIEITNDSGYPLDKDALLSEPVYLRTGDIKVLILHTHTSEAYSQSPGNEYGESDSYRNEIDEKNIVSVGNVIENVLKERNIGVIHDKTYHDYPSYSGSYKRALDTINANLAQHPSITLVLDVHRDAISDQNGTYMKTLAQINGEQCAQGLVVIGTDAGGLEHPNWRENLKFGLQLQKIMCEKYPSLARPLHLRTERFNGQAREGAMIIEIGSNGNTLPEAQKAALYMGDCIASLIESLESR